VASSWLAVGTRSGVFDLYFECGSDQGFSMNNSCGVITGRVISSRVYLSFALALVLIGPVGASSWAQTGLGSGPPNSGPVGGQATRVAENLASATRQHHLDSVLGREVRTRVEEDVGRIVDLLADREGRVQAAVIEFGGFLGIGTRKIAVDWSALSFETDGRRPVVVLDLARDQLRRAPEYKPNEPVAVVRASTTLPESD
jgi:hypothetical protein